MITGAQKQAEGFNLPVEHIVGGAYRLDFAASTLDGCRAERVFQHVDNPQRGLGEMVRVTRPGGRVVVLDPDFETLIIDAQARALTRAWRKQKTLSLRSWSEESKAGTGVGK
jgi:ubiquinone/menaquinone biosynthesis C-methylase UbiE